MTMTNDLTIQTSRLHKAKMAIVAKRMKDPAFVAKFAPKAELLPPGEYEKRLYNAANKRMKWTSMLDVASILQGETFKHN
jgi:hypothetical protein